MLSASEVAEGIHNGLYARMDSSSIYGVCSEKSPVITSLLFFLLSTLNYSVVPNFFRTKGFRNTLD